MDCLRRRNEPMLTTEKNNRYIAMIDSPDVSLDLDYNN
jgi:hypothetical protein